IASGSALSVSVRTATEWTAAAETITAESAELADENLSLRPLRAPRLPSSDQPGLFDEPLPAAPARAEQPLATIEIVDTHRGDRPGGARFGELVHAVLASTALDADHEAVRAMAEVQGRILSAPADEVTTAATLVSRVLAHDLLGRARRAAARGTCRREAPLTWSAANGTLVEG